MKTNLKRLLSNGRAVAIFCAALGAAIGTALGVQDAIHEYARSFYGETITFTPELATYFAIIGIVGAIGGLICGGAMGLVIPLVIYAFIAIRIRQESHAGSNNAANAAADSATRPGNATPIPEQDAQHREAAGERTR